MVRTRSEDRQMKPLRTLVVPIIISALAVAGITSAPARAGNDDLARLLIGLGVIAITARAIEANKKSNQQDVVSRSNRVVRLPQHERRRERISFALPADCIRTYSSDGRNRTLYSGRCLSQVPYTLAKLPSACS